MKKFFLVLASFIFSMSLMAQEKVTPVSDVNALKSEMQVSAGKIKTISSDFTQEKFMSVMASKMVSKGKFYYQKEDKVTLQYLTPFKQNLVMNGPKLMMEANGKKNVCTTPSIYAILPLTPRIFLNLSAFSQTIASIPAEQELMP